MQNETMKNKQDDIDNTPWASTPLAGKEFAWVDLLGAEQIEAAREGQPVLHQRPRRQQQAANAPCIELPTSVPGGDCRGPASVSTFRLLILRPEWRPRRSLPHPDVLANAPVSVRAGTL